MTLADLDRAVTGLAGIHAAEALRVHDLDAQLATLVSEQAVLTGADEALKVLLATVQQELQRDVEALVSYGLRTVFPDLTLGFTLALSEKRGGPWCDALLTEGAVTAPVLDAFGGGPATVAAFLLRVLTIRRTGLAPVLILDEPFSMVSTAYRPLVGKLLRELADKAGLTILMVTHETAEYLPYATRGYEIVKTEAGSICRAVS